VATSLSRRWVWTVESGRVQRLLALADRLGGVRIGPVERIDGRMGQAIELAVGAHHRRAAAARPMARKGRDVQQHSANASSQLLVYADGPLEHGVSLLALIADGLKHPCSQRVELALDRGLGAELGILQQSDEQ
jgi:hypothetical protein